MGIRILVVWVGGRVGGWVSTPPSKIPQSDLYVGVLAAPQTIGIRGIACGGACGLMGRPYEFVAI